LITRVRWTPPVAAPIEPVLRAPGSGGYGEPAGRDRARRRDDVVNGYVSAAVAAAEYGHADHASLACPDCSGAG
jgi:hypothetical protein